MRSGQGQSLGIPRRVGLLVAFLLVQSILVWIILRFTHQAPQWFGGGDRTWLIVAGSICILCALCATAAEVVYSKRMLWRKGASRVCARCGYPAPTTMSAIRCSECGSDLTQSNALAVGEVDAAAVRNVTWTVRMVAALGFIVGVWFLVEAALT